MGAKTDTSNGCMRCVLFSGRKMNLIKKIILQVPVPVVPYCRHMYDGLKPSHTKITVK
jgi:hypothetical protein